VGSGAVIIGKVAKARLRVQAVKCNDHLELRFGIHPELQACITSSSHAEASSRSMVIGSGNGHPLYSYAADQEWHRMGMHRNHSDEAVQGDVLFKPCGRWNGFDAL